MIAGELTVEQRIDGLTQLVKSIGNIERAARVVERAQWAIQRELVKPGHEWADDMVAAMRDAGEQQARANLRSRKRGSRLLQSRDRRSRSPGQPRPKSSPMPRSQTAIAWCSGSMTANWCRRCSINPG